MADHHRVIRDGTVSEDRPPRVAPSAARRCEVNPLSSRTPQRAVWYPSSELPGAPAVKPWTVVLGVRCGLFTGAAWLALSLLRLPSELWGEGRNHSGFWGVTALFGAVVILLSVATGARSPRCWLLLQLSNALITIVTTGAAITLLSAYRDAEDDLMALLCVLTGPLQLLAMVVLNRRSARRFCRVDPEGYRILL